MSFSPIGGLDPNNHESDLSLGKCKIRRTSTVLFLSRLVLLGQRQDRYGIGEAEAAANDLR